MKLELDDIVRASPWGFRILPNFAHIFQPREFGFAYSDSMWIICLTGFRVPTCDAAKEDDSASNLIDKMAAAKRAIEAIPDGDGPTLLKPTADERESLPLHAPAYMVAHGLNAEQRMLRLVRGAGRGMIEHAAIESFFQPGYPHVTASGVAAENAKDAAALAKAEVLGRGRAELSAAAHGAGVAELLASSDAKPETCYGCQEREGTKRCMACYHAWYCSKPCQTRDWQTHKLACKRLVALAEVAIVVCKERDILLRSNEEYAKQRVKLIEQRGKLEDNVRYAEGASIRATLHASKADEALVREQEASAKLAIAHAALQQQLQTLLSTPRSTAPLRPAPPGGAPLAEREAKIPAPDRAELPDPSKELEVKGERAVVLAHVETKAEERGIEFSMPACWQFEGSDGWQNYPLEVSAALETCRAQKKDEYRYDAYRVHLLLLFQENCQTRTRRDVRRCDPLMASARYFIRFPGAAIGAGVARISASTSSIELAKGNLMLWLGDDDEERKAIASYVERELPDVTVTAVAKNFSKRYLVYAQLGQQLGNEVHLLWHGSRGASPETLMREGLDPRLAAEGYLGRGAYLARSPAYCHKGGYAHNPHHNKSHSAMKGERVLLACRAHLGRVQFVGSVDSASAQTSRTRPDRGFDSLAALVGDEMIHAVYHPDQAYPAYLVHYTLPLGQF